jgi:hypothetical protein
VSDPLPKLGTLVDAFFSGAAKITDGTLARYLNHLWDEAAIISVIWAFQTNSATQYAGGFYEFNSGSNDFSPSINFGTANKAKSAHFSIVTGAITGDALTVRVTGPSITDAGVRVASDSEDIVVPAGTAANSYFESSKKWIGQVTVEAVAGTPIQCNYGWTKYHDADNTDFEVVGFEALWESDSSDAASDIELLHHRATGWTFNGVGEPTTPAPIASRSADTAPDDEHEIGAGAYKRSPLATQVNGSDSEGVLIRVTSGNLGVGTLSFRSLTLELSIRLFPDGFPS